MGQYAQLKKKGRHFICLCPFHTDKNPSFLVSPDKGIAYCFSCNNGGDIFSLYQKLEGVDFSQAIHDLAERTGVKVEGNIAPTTSKDEKDRLRDCLKSASAFYMQQLKADASTMAYLQKRGVKEAQMQEFSIGKAPDSFTATYDHLLKAGYSKTEIIASGIGAQKDLQEERVYDRFRNRLMFPIEDVQGKIVGFGGRTLGNDDAKYINTADGPLYHKSSVLFGLHKARDAMREKKRAILVEGYFDVLACHQVGLTEAVACCGTALTEDHVRLLKRYAEHIILCFDQDNAGKLAAQKAFQLLMKEGVLVSAVTLSTKDPADLVQENPALLSQVFDQQVEPYFQTVLRDIRSRDLSSPQEKRDAINMLIPLLNSFSMAVERTQAIADAAAVLGVPAGALEEDARKGVRETVSQVKEVSAKKHEPFSAMEVALGILLLYPKYRSHVSDLLEPITPFPKAIYAALQVQDTSDVKKQLPEEFREKADILCLYCEQHGLADVSDSLIQREIVAHCTRANHYIRKQILENIMQELRNAQASGDTGRQQQLLEEMRKIPAIPKTIS